MENTPLFSMIIGIMGLVFVVYYFAKNGFKLNQVGGNGRFRLLDACRRRAWCNDC